MKWWCVDVHMTNGIRLLDLKPGIGSNKTITWRTRMFKNYHDSPPVTQHWNPRIRRPRCRLSTQLQFQVGGNPKRHVLLKTIEKREASDTWWQRTWRNLWLQAPVNVRVGSRQRPSNLPSVVHIPWGQHVFSAFFLFWVWGGVTGHH